MDNHKRFIDLAASNDAAMIIFPELSMTGYEPGLAKALAIYPDDKRLDDFQHLADSRHITIGLGLPLKSPVGITISMLVFSPHQIRQYYSKQYLHSDEEEFFVPGRGTVELIGDQPVIAPAICYELSVPQHSEQASQKGASIYLASVAKSAAGVDHAARTLADIARKYRMTVLMCNCIGPADNFTAAGTSSIWNDQGRLLAQLDQSSEGILIVDTHTQDIIEKTVISNRS